MPVAMIAMYSHQIIFIVGPTAVGKSEVALLLAEQIEGEIISCDSMQVYKEISILNNKPSPEILKKIPHHLIGHVSITEEYDVVRFNKEALKEITQILKKDKTPIIVGGTGLYMTILLEGIFEGAPRDTLLRNKLERLADQKGNELLYNKLKEVDPKAALKIHMNDRRRIIRALEVHMLEGQPISERQKDRRGIWGHYDIKIFALNTERTQLYKAINLRVEQMFEDGAVEEVKNCVHFPWSQTAKGIIGVEAINQYLAGERSLQETKDMIKQQTRQYAKRQMTWFRREKRLEWIMLEPAGTPRMVVKEIGEKLEASAREVEKQRSKK